MSGPIRVLDSANRTMQRLGYLKILCAIVNETETSNLSSLGNRLIERISKTFRMEPPFDLDIQEYAKHRLYDGAYRNLRKTILNDSGTAVLQAQDYYLSDHRLPSCTGKLVAADFRFFPYLGTSLEFIKKGTYSALTRSLVLLNVTPREELEAFSNPNKDFNPFILSELQSMVFLFCLLDNDGEVILPLYNKLFKFDKDSSFSERDAGDLLPEIFRNIVSSHNKRALTVEERKRLVVIQKTSSSIEKWKGKPYSGSGAREISIRVRLEPFCDLKFLDKPDRNKFDYSTNQAARVLVERWSKFSDTERFLEEDYFSTYANCRGWKAKEASEESATNYLLEAGQYLKSSLGYTTIRDVGLLGGIKLLYDRHEILELSRTTELLKSLQKKFPDLVRFTVDRMGKLAYVKFLKSGQLT